MISEKEKRRLLLMDLGMRLGYGVMILDIPAKRDGKIFILSTLDDYQYDTDEDSHYQSVYNILPYLRPMESMTKEEASEMFRLMYTDRNLISVDIEKDGMRFGYTKDGVFCHVFLLFNEIYSLKQLDWYNKKMFDYRGLIPMGIALEAKEGMYNIKEK